MLKRYGPSEDRTLPWPAPALDADDTGPHDPGMEQRVAKLEARADQADKRLDRIETKLDQLVAAVHEMRGAMVTKGDMRNYLLTALGLAAFVFALTLAGASYLAPASGPPQPIVIQVPAQAGP